MTAKVPKLTMSTPQEVNDLQLDFFLHGVKNPTVLDLPLLFFRDNHCEVADHWPVLAKFYKVLEKEDK